MIRIRGAKTMDGEMADLEIPGRVQQEYSAEGLTLLPGVIDTHVSFREPGHGYKEDWISGAQAAIAGGVTTVFDMPNNSPPCVTEEALRKKKELIDTRLASVDIPLRYRLYFGADSLEEIPKVKKQIVGIKVCSLHLDSDQNLDRLFQMAGENGLVVSVHAEDEGTIIANQKKFAGNKDPAVHSQIRSREAACKAVKRAIAFADKHAARLCILHISTMEELELVSQAKKKGIDLYCGVAPHHLFFDTQDYAVWGTRLQINPPLRELRDREALWDGLRSGMIDLIGTDHAPHTLEEKMAPYGEAPSGVPSVELCLPLFLDAVNRGRLSLKRLVEVTSQNAQDIFSLPETHDYVLVDMKRKKRVEDGHLKTKCLWSPYAGRELQGWPVATILKGSIHELEKGLCRV